MGGATLTLVFIGMPSEHRRGWLLFAVSAVVLCVTPSCMQRKTAYMKAAEERLKARQTAASQEDPASSPAATDPPAATEGKNEGSPQSQRVLHYFDAANTVLQCSVHFS